MASAAMAKTSPAEFIREVRREVAKVTWPTRKETTVSTGMVFLMVVLASIFFLIVDQTIGLAMKLILRIGG
jgi:preprotein translocase subunit SecE